MGWCTVRCTSEPHLTFSHENCKLVLSITRQGDYPPKLATLFDHFTHLIQYSIVSFSN